MSSRDDSNKDATVTVNVDDFTKSRDSVSFSFPYFFLSVPCFVLVAVLGLLSQTRL